MTTAPPLPADSPNAAPAARGPHPVEIALLASVFVVAACGLLYELAAGAIASYVLGDSVLQFSTIIGSYLFAMGIGSWLSRYFEDHLPAHFLRIELMVALVGGAAEMASAFSGARKNRLDLSVGIALGSASQIALFVAPVLVLLSYVIGPAPMDLLFWPGAVVMILIATITVVLVTNSGQSAWYTGVLMLMVYLIFAMTLYLLPVQ